MIILHCVLCQSVAGTSLLEHLPNATNRFQPAFSGMVVEIPKFWHMPSIMEHFEVLDHFFSTLANHFAHVCMQSLQMDFEFLGLFLAVHPEGFAGLFSLLCCEAFEELQCFVSAGIVTR